MKLEKDSLQYILCKKMKQKTGKKEGEEVSVILGYYGQLKHLFEALVAMEILDNFPEVERMLAIQEDLQRFIEKIYKQEKGK